MSRERRRLATLRRLQRLRKLERDVLAGAVAQSGHALQQAQRGTAEAKAELEGFCNDFGDKVATVAHPRELELLGDEHDHALANLAHTHQAVSRAQREHARRCADLSRADNQLAVTETLVGRCLDALRRKVERAEQIALDDLAPTRKKAAP